MDTSRLLFTASPLQYVTLTVLYYRGSPADTKELRHNLVQHLPVDILHRISSLLPEVQDILSFRLSCSTVTNALDHEGW